MIIGLKVLWIFLIKLFKFNVIKVVCLVLFLMCVRCKSVLNVLVIWLICFSVVISVFGLIGWLFLVVEIMLFLSCVCRCVSGVCKLCVMFEDCICICVMVFLRWVVVILICLVKRFRLLFLFRLI